jgi:putative ABC transport system permease protein
MTGLATKSLLQDRTRFAMSAGGVALSIMLVLLLVGMYVGVNRQITAYMDNTETDLLVAQEGTRNFLGARSLLPIRAEELAARTSGVAGVVPVVSQYAIVDLEDRKEFSLLVGFDADKGGGPWDISAGNGVPEAGQVVADNAVARARGLELDDSVRILGKRFEVVGLSSGTSSWMTGSFFMTFDDASALVSTGGRPSFLLVRAKPGQNADTLATRLRLRMRDVTVSTREEINANDRQLYARILNGPMGFMVLVAFLIGTAVVGLTIFTATSERAKEYGTLKAIGIRNGRLYAIVFQQALISTATGAVGGVLLALAAAWAIPLLNPRFMIVIEPTALAVMAAVAFFMGSVAGLIPARAVAAIDPAIAFRRGV